MQDRKRVVRHVVIENYQILAIAISQRRRTIETAADRLCHFSGPLAFFIV
jgi:hypothetical protein